MADLLKDRLVSSFLVLTLSLLVILYFPNWVFCIIVIYFTGMALYEFYTMVEKKGTRVYKYFGTFLGILVPLFTCLEYDMRTQDIVPFWLVLIALFIFIRQFGKKDTTDILYSTSTTLFGILYISWFFSFMIRLKYMPNGSLIVLFLIILTEGGDAGAYFLGKRFGKKPLFPRVSPKKTVEGTFGGFVTTLVLALICRSLIPEISLWQVIMAGLLIGVVAPLADLVESLFKRDCGVKDSGTSLPGLGGFLDMLDSIFLTAPVLYFYLISFCGHLR